MSGYHIIGAVLLGLASAFFFGRASAFREISRAKRRVIPSHKGMKP